MSGTATTHCSAEQLLEHLPQIIWTSRPDGFTTYINQYGREYLGVETADFLGWGWLRSVHPADVGRTLEAWSEATATGLPYSVEYRIRIACGDYRWQHSRAESLCGDDGSITCWVGSTVETERWKQHEQHLRSANQQIDETVTVLSLLENHSPVGFALIDTKFRFIRVNEALAEMTGMSRCDHRGQTVEAVLPQLWPKLRPILETVSRTQQPVLNHEVVGETPARPGEQRQWVSSYHPVMVNDEFLGVGIIVREITAQKQVEQQLQALLVTRSNEA